MRVGNQDRALKLGARGCMSDRSDRATLQLQQDVFTYPRLSLNVLQLSLFPNISLALHEPPHRLFSIYPRSHYARCTVAVSYHL
jgi:hypothetical protein